MKITREWLEKHSACEDGKEFFLSLNEQRPAHGVRALMGAGKLDWANWLITRVMDRKQRIQYAVYAAEQVIDLYEKQFPNDDRPRKAIEAAKKVIRSNTEENRLAAVDAAYAAYAAYAAAYAAKAASGETRILNYGLKLLERRG